MKKKQLVTVSACVQNGCWKQKIKRKNLGKTAALILTLIMSAGSTICVYGADENSDGVQYCIAENVAYADEKEEYHLLDVYRDESNHEQPLIIEIHGGGLVGGSKETNSAHSDYFAEKGYTVVTPNYTLMPDGDYKTAVQDFFKVFSWVEENAQEYHYSTDEIFLDGDSAGGYYVSLLAAVLNDENLQEYYEVNVPEGFEVKGYAAGCPMADQEAVANAYKTGEGINGYFAEIIGGDILENEETVKMADLFQIINPETYPEIYILTTPDDQNYYNDAVKFADFLNSEEISHVYKEYESKENQLNHVFEVSNVDWSESIQANDDILAYFSSLLDTESAEASQTEKIKVDCVGDSLTYGQGAENPETGSYPALLQQLLGDKYEVGNYGKRGHTLTENGVCYRDSDAYQETLDNKAQIYIIMLGTNDSHPDTWDAEQYENDLNNLIDGYFAVNEDADVYLMTPPHIYDFDGKYIEEAKIIEEEVAPIVRTVAEERNLKLIDIWNLTADHDDWYIEDGMHMNDTGYAALAEYIDGELD